MLENRSVGLGPLPRAEYGARQPEVTQAMMEAGTGLSAREFSFATLSTQWRVFKISRGGEKLLQRYSRENSGRNWRGRGQHDLMNGEPALWRPAGKPRSSHGVGAAEGK